MHLHHSLKAFQKKGEAKKAVNEEAITHSLHINTPPNMSADATKKQPYFETTHGHQCRKIAQEIDVVAGTCRAM